jgi:hypothetical protein
MKILQKLSEYDWQLPEAYYRRGERLSLAVAKLLCCDAKDSRKLAFMRIYLQVPYSGTEENDADSRATQAITYIPRELLAYQDLASQNLGFTPNLLGYKNLNTRKVGAGPGRIRRLTSMREGSRSMPR